MDWLEIEVGGTKNWIFLLVVVAEEAVAVLHAWKEEVQEVGAVWVMIQIKQILIGRRRDIIGTPPARFVSLNRKIFKAFL